MCVGRTLLSDAFDFAFSSYAFIPPLLISVAAAAASNRYDQTKGVTNHVGTAALGCPVERSSTGFPGEY